MRNILLFILIHVSTHFCIYSQSSGVGFLFDETSFYFSTDNLNFTTDVSPWGFYTTYRVVLIPGDPFIVNSAYLNRLGISYMSKSEVISLGCGAKMTYDTEPKFYPDFMFKFHPSRILTEKTRNVDVGLLFNVSNTLDFGVCLSLPFVLNRY